MSMEELVRDTIIYSSFDCNVHETMETQTLKGLKKESNRVQTLCFIDLESRRRLCKENDMRDSVKDSSEGQRSLENLGSL